MRDLILEAYAEYEETGGDRLAESDGGALRRFAAHSSSKRKRRRRPIRDAPGEWANRV